ncbi:PTS sugar transporter subunit IIA [Facklamia lactis]|nr:PTS sugar transporter subunit IIA [Facklamia lactis]
MDMKDFLFEDLVKVDMNSTNKKEAINELSELLYEKNCINDIEAFVKDVYLREAEGDTNIGQGIAIPHGKSEHVLKTSLAIGKINPIEWDSSDDEKVELVILFAVRMVDKTSVHLKLLSQVASKLGNDEVLEKLKSANSPSEVLSVFF